MRKPLLLQEIGRTIEERNDDVRRALAAAPPTEPVPAVRPQSRRVCCLEPTAIVDARMAARDAARRRRPHRDPRCRPARRHSTGHRHRRSSERTSSAERIRRWCDVAQRGRISGVAPHRQPRIHFIHTGHTVNRWQRSRRRVGIVSQPRRRPHGVDSRIEPRPRDSLTLAKQRRLLEDKGCKERGGLLPL